MSTERVQLPWAVARRERSTPFEILTALRIVGPPPVPIFKMLESLRVAVRFVSDPRWDVVTEVDDECATISLRANAPSPARRFAAAFALGHVVLHRAGTYRHASVRCPDDCDGEDQEASVFASALLMPRFMLQPLMYEARMTMGALVELCAVQPSVLEARIRAIREGAD